MPNGFSGDLGCGTEARRDHALRQFARQAMVRERLQFSWQKFRRKLEREGILCPGLTLYGLRHTVAVILREMGYDDRTIADALGEA